MYKMVSRAGVVAHTCDPSSWKVLSYSKLQTALRLVQATEKDCLKGEKSTITQENKTLKP